MSNIKQRVALGNTKQALVISEIEFHTEGPMKGFQKSQRTGILGIDPDQNPQDMLAAAKNMRFELTGEPNRVSGFYDVVIVGPLEEGALVKETNNSATADVGDDDVVQTRR